MQTYLSRARAAPIPFTSVRFPALTVGVGAALLGLLAISLLIRTQALGASLWIDEGLSIGIASHSLVEIPGVLRQDGAPPLYYLLLSAWMTVVGSGPAETQALSLVFALATVPTALWAGWSLFGRRAGLVCAALAALSPYLTVYAQETRMYSLLALLGLVSTTAFVHAFVHRRRAFVPVFAVALALTFYTHNWGLLLGVGMFAALVPCLLATAERRSLARDAALGFGGAALLYAPWVPTLLFQVGHTGAPWLNPPSPAAPLDVVGSLLGGPGAAVALGLACAVGLASLLGTGGLHAERAARGSDPARTAVLALLAIALVTLTVAWLVSQVSPAWTGRYFGAVLGAVALLAAVGIARAGRVGAAALAVVLVLWAIPDTSALESKSNAAVLAAEAAPELERGDLVISTQAEQTPLLAYHLPEGLNYATPLGKVRDPGVMDWRDAMDRLETARPAQTLDPLLAKLPQTRRVLLVHPVTDSGGWDAPWTQLVRRRSAQWGRALVRDKRFVTEAALPSFYDGASRVGVRAVLYRKAPAGRAGAREQPDAGPAQRQIKQ